MANTVPVTLIIRNDTAAAWAAVNPILKQGELAVETDTNFMKVGDGTTAWSDLPYCSSETELMPATTDTLGGIIVGDDLSITNEGRLSVITANASSQDNTHPITAAAVYTEIGNINVLLETI